MPSAAIGGFSSHSHLNVGPLTYEATKDNKGSIYRTVDNSEFERTCVKAANCMEILHKSTHHMRKSQATPSDGKSGGRNQHHHRISTVLVTPSAPGSGLPLLNIPMNTRDYQMNLGSLSAGRGSNCLW